MVGGGGGGELTSISSAKLSMLSCDVTTLTGVLDCKSSIGSFTFQLMALLEILPSSTFTLTSVLATRLIGCSRVAAVAVNVEEVKSNWHATFDWDRGSAPLAPVLVLPVVQTVTLEEPKSVIVLEFLFLLGIGPGGSDAGSSDDDDGFEGRLLSESIPSSAARESSEGFDGPESKLPLVTHIDEAGTVNVLGTSLEIRGGG